MSAVPRRHWLASGVLTLTCILGCQTGPGAQVGPYPVGPSGEVAPLVCTRGVVIDGDTLELVCGGEPVRVRLHCIDAPELGQGRWGRASREHLRSLVPRIVIVLPKPTDLGYRDRFGRIVGELLSPDESRRNLNLALVLSGQAAVYPKYCDGGALLLGRAGGAPLRGRDLGHRGATANPMGLAARGLIRISWALCAAGRAGEPRGARYRCVTLRSCVTRSRDHEITRSRDHEISETQRRGSAALGATSRTPEPTVELQRGADSRDAGGSPRGRSHGSCTPQAVYQPLFSKGLRNCPV